MRQDTQAARLNVLGRLKRFSTRKHGLRVRRALESLDEQQIEELGKVMNTGEGNLSLALRDLNGLNRNAFLYHFLTREFKDQELKDMFRRMLNSQKTLKSPQPTTYSQLYRKVTGMDSNLGSLVFDDDKQHEENDSNKLFDLFVQEAAAYAAEKKIPIVDELMVSRRKYKLDDATYQNIKNAVLNNEPVAQAYAFWPEKGEKSDEWFIDCIGSLIMQDVGEEQVYQWLKNQTEELAGDILRPDNLENMYEYLMKPIFGFAARPKYNISHGPNLDKKDIWYIIYEVFFPYTWFIYTTRVARLKQYAYLNLTVEEQQKYEHMYWKNLAEGKKLENVISVIEEEGPNRKSKLPRRLTQDLKDEIKAEIVKDLNHRIDTGRRTALNLSEYMEILGRNLRPYASLRTGLDLWLEQDKDELENFVKTELNRYSEVMAAGNEEQFNIQNSRIAVFIRRNDEYTAGELNFGTLPQSSWKLLGLRYFRKITEEVKSGKREAFPDLSWMAPVFRRFESDYKYLPDQIGLPYLKEAAEDAVKADSQVSCSEDDLNDFFAFLHTRTVTE